ncbi:MAG: hypothetical protein L3J63_09985, partial [Geopsychrobacter sp.]|nr:hypothetical protein [Geopsychrobacter sp.]
MNLPPISNRAEEEQIFGQNLLTAEAPALTQQMRFSEALNQLRKGTAFTSSSVDGVCAVKIKGFVPLVCT